MSVGSVCLVVAAVLFLVLALGVAWFPGQLALGLFFFVVGVLLRGVVVGGAVVAP